MNSASPQDQGISIRWRSVLVNWYFYLNFVAVMGIGIAAYRARIKNYQIIPVVILAYAALLPPWRLPRLVMGYAVLLLFPIAVWYNAYGYAVAMQCWMPVLINFLFINLEKPDFRTFLGATGFHLAVLIGLFAGFPHPTLSVDLLGVVTNAFGACLLAFIMWLWMENRRLSAWNLALAEKNQDISHGLKNVVRAVFHDLSLWFQMAKTGIERSREPDQGLDEFIRRGVEGATELAQRIREIIRVDEFAFLDDYPLINLLAEVEASAKVWLAVHIALPPELAGTWIHTDKGILKNALMNLAENSGKAGAKEIEFRAERNNGRIDLEVLDDGRGFPKEITRIIFRRPVQSRTGGTGNGLLNVKFTLAFIGADILLVDPNDGGGGKTHIRITGIRQSEKRETAWVS